MLTSIAITVKIGNSEHDIFVSPLLLQSKELPNLKPGKIGILYFYDHLWDDDYKAMLEQDVLAERFKSDRFIINYGQDFAKYYLGSLCVDFDAKSYWQWEGKSSELTSQDVKNLAEAFFNPKSQNREVTMLTLTRPSDFNFTII